MSAIIEGFIIFDALGDESTLTVTLAGVALGPAAHRGTASAAAETCVRAKTEPDVTHG